MSVDTLPALFLHAVRTHNKPDAFRSKVDGRYVSVSHRSVYGSVHDVCEGLLAMGLTHGDRVALLSENRLEWAVADLAILFAGCINVPIYATLPANQVAYILRDSEARAVFVSTREQMEKIESIRNDLPNLQHVICFEADAVQPGAISFDELLAKGAAAEGRKPIEDHAATVGKYDWASIIYTSGTTGDPKGVILNHWNFVSNVLAALRAIEIDSTDTCLSFLPLSHVFERTGGYYAMLHDGCTIAYAESIDTVPENLLEVQPTVMISVPRLYEKMYARIMDAVAAGPRIKKELFHWAAAVGSVYTKQSLEARVSTATKLKYGIATRLVFHKLKARTGGRLRFFVSGGAPLSREIAEFFYAAGLPILEGYGLTETSPVITCNTFKHFKFGTVGRPLQGVTVRIADDGEIVVKGPNIMLGYYKRPDLSEKVLDGEWFHTGDIGFIDNEGFLTITDRKKDIIVTAGGKNVAPQPIENLLKTNKYITQVVVVGNRRKFISALIVPNMETVRHYADAAGIEYDGDETLIKDARIEKKIFDEIQRMSEHLAGYERIKKFILVEQDFSIEDGEMTPTMKVKRNVIEKKFKEAIDALYTG